MTIFKTGIGQSIYRFCSEDSSKICLVGGVIFEDCPGLDSSSDGDVVFHAICNAITTLTQEPILNEIAAELIRKDGITDSSVYVQKALQYLKNYTITHIALTLEAKRPHLQLKLLEMKKKVAGLLKIDFDKVGICVIDGHGITECSLGKGIACICLLSVQA